MLVRARRRPTPDNSKLADMDDDVPTTLSHPRLRAQAVDTPTARLVPARGPMGSDPTLTLPGDEPPTTIRAAPGSETPPTAIRAAPVTSPPAPPSSRPLALVPSPSTSRPLTLAPSASRSLVPAPAASRPFASSPSTSLAPGMVSSAPAPAPRDEAPPFMSARTLIVLTLLIAFASGMGTTYGLEVVLRAEPVLAARSPRSPMRLVTPLSLEGTAAGKQEVAPAAPSPRRVHHRRRPTPSAPVTETGAPDTGTPDTVAPEAVAPEAPAMLRGPIGPELALPAHQAP